MILYYLPSKSGRWQKSVLLLAGCSFYLYYSFWGLLLLLFTALINAITTWFIYTRRNPKIYSTTGVIFNLVILVFFKCAHLLELTPLYLDNNIGSLIVALPLPLGISFYTFSGISLMIDTYKSSAIDNWKTSEVMNESLCSVLLNCLQYFLFFPKMAQGPIMKSTDFFRQIDSRKCFMDISWEYVFRCLVVGFFLKMVIADNLKDFTFWMNEYYNSFGSGTLLLFTFGYTVQLFSDFAGYSLIAIGVASMLGYKLPQNFNFPYVSSSFHDFWKRWHITLSQFLMQYLYFGLGGNRKGKMRTYINLILTMTLGGIWHGVGISYILWGFVHGCALAIERMSLGDRLKKEQEWSKSFRVTYTLFVFVCVSFLWLFFAIPDYGHFVGFIKCLFNLYRGVAFLDLKQTPIIVYAFPIVFWHIIYLCRNKRWATAFRKFDYLWLGIMLFLIISNSGTSSPFIYIQF